VGSGGGKPDTTPGGELPPERPHRVQLSRRKGWRMPPNTVKVDRTTKWGNPYVVGSLVSPEGFPWHDRKPLTASAAVLQFRAMWGDRLNRDPFALRALRGKNLACWCHLCPAHADGKPFGVDCPDCAPCHADPLGELANAAVRSVP